jgi:hypothetical protein
MGRARFEQALDAGRIIREALLKLDQRRGNAVMPASCEHVFDIRS